MALLATGGSTNHTMHLVAIAAAAGIELLWDDLAALSKVVPLLTRMYPNGQADVNHFQAAGGMQVLIGDLLDAGLLHGDVLTVAGRGLGPLPLGRRAQGRRAGLGGAHRAAAPTRTCSVPSPTPSPPTAASTCSTATWAARSARSPRSRTSTWSSRRPAKVFDDQLELLRAFEAGELDGQDFVAVIRYQGPSANGMPELHKLTPPLAVLLDRGQRVAIVTDGRMSGASGKVPAAIHLSPEAADGGPIALVRDGDPIRLDAAAGTLELLVPAEELAARTPQGAPLTDAQWVGTGRELFAAFRRAAGPAERGAGIFALNGHAESVAGARAPRRLQPPGEPRSCVSGASAKEVL